MRLFFALQPDQQTAMGIAAWRDRQFSLPGRPVPPANFHVTLAFIGEVPSRSLEALCDDVDRWCERAAPRGGSFHLDQTGYWHRPGIYWLGPARWPESLQNLAEGLRSIAVRAGGKRERKRFQPHVTLFRNCAVAPPAPSTFPKLPLAYSEFYLVESVQGRRGVNYQAIAHWELAPPG